MARETTTRMTSDDYDPLRLQDGSNFSMTGHSNVLETLNHYNVSLTTMSNFLPTSEPETSTVAVSAAVVSTSAGYEHFSKPSLTTADKHQVIVNNCCI